MIVGRGGGADIRVAQTVGREAERRGTGRLQEMPRRQPGYRMRCTHEAMRFAGPDDDPCSGFARCRADLHDTVDHTDVANLSRPCGRRDPVAKMDVRVVIAGREVQWDVPVLVAQLDPDAGAVLSFPVLEVSVLSGCAVRVDRDAIRIEFHAPA